MNNMKKIVCCILAVILISLSARTIAGFDVKVVDGDSLEIKGKRIRLLGIDAPEYFQECYDVHNQKYACGQNAKKYLEYLIEDGQTRGEKLKCKMEGTDRYKRELSVCYIGKKNLNLQMIKAGYALSYKDDRYLAAEKRAHHKKKGIWQGKFMRPEIYRALQREQEKQKNI